MQDSKNSVIFVPEIKWGLASEIMINVREIATRTEIILGSNRLQRHSEWKYPNRMWTIDAYYGIAFQWMGKEKELEERVLKLENDMRLAGAL